MHACSWRCLWHRRGGTGKHICDADLVLVHPVDLGVVLCRLEGRVPVGVALDALLALAEVAEQALGVVANELDGFGVAVGIQHLRLHSLGTKHHDCWPFQS